MSKDKNYKRSETSELKQTIRSLKGKLAHRDKKIKNLLSEIKTLQAALDESVVYIDDRLADIPVEDIVRYFKKRNSGKLDGVKTEYEKNREALREKWTCHECNEGYLKIIIFNRHDGKHYFRSCTNCENRTRTKVFTEDVEGVE